MSRLGVPTLGWLTSILLSLVTLFVFFTLRDYGPDSSVRKFHLAAEDLNREEAAPLVYPDFNSSSTQELWSLVAGLMANGRTNFEIAHYQRKANQAAIAVRYRFPNGEQRTLIWLVNRIEGKWRIDTRETTLAARYLMSP